MMINFTPVSRPEQVPSLDAPPLETTELRCQCGSLLARLCLRGVELKCRRCKRVVLVPWSAGTSWHGFTIEWGEPRPAGERGSAPG